MIDEIQMRSSDGSIAPPAPPPANLSPNGLHADKDKFTTKPSPEAYENKTRQAREALVHCGGNKVHAAGYLGVNVKTLEKWLGKPITGSKRLQLFRVQVEAVVDELLANLPAKIKDASLSDSVKALKDLTPILKELNVVTASADKKKSVSHANLQNLAKARLAKLKKREADAEEKPN